MTHYQALELPEHAAAADIRRAYRRLVLLTHPDRTPDPTAHARYLAINAAYEVLSEPRRRIAYDASMHTQPMAPPPTSPGRARDAAHRAAWAARPQREAVPLTVRYAAEYARCLRVFRPLLAASLLLCASLMIDFGLATEHLEKVLDEESIFHYVRRNSYYTTRYQTDRGTFTLLDNLRVGPQVQIRRTPLWGTAISARLAPSEPRIPCSSVYHGAGNFFWVGLLLTAAFGITPRFNNDQRVMAALTAVLFLGLTLMQLLR